MSISRILFGLLFLIMMAFVAWAFGAGHFWKECVQIWALPWGRVALIDFSLGILCMITIIFAFERNLLAALGWSVALILVGNAIAALWLALHGREFYRRLSRR